MGKKNRFKRLLMECALAAAIGATGAPVLAANAIDEAYRLDSRALQLHSQKYDDQAIPLAERALKIKEQSIGPEHLDTALSLNNLALYYTTIGAYAKPERLYQRALAIREKHLGTKHSLTALTLNNLADFYRATGSYGKSEQLYQQALGILEDLIDLVPEDAAKVMNNLAALYRVTGAYEKAEPLYQRSLEIFKKLFGPGNSKTAVVMNNLALLYESMGDYSRAKTLYQKALEIQKNELEYDDPEIAKILNNLADLYRITGVYDQAELLFRQALLIQEKRRGANHPETATSLNNLAVLYESKGDYSRAELFYKRALIIRGKAFDLNHPETTASLNNLAELYRVTGAYGRAEPLYRQALAIREKVLGPAHPDIALSLNNWAVLKWARGDFAQALSLQVRANEIIEINAARLLQTGTENRRRQYLATLHHDASVSYSLADPVPEARALGAAAVLQLKGRVLDATTDAMSRVRRHLDERSRAQLKELQLIVAERSKVSVDGPDAQGVEAWRQRLDELGHQQEILEGELSSRSSEFLQGIQPVTLPRVQAALDAQDVLVEWTRFKPFDPRGRTEEEKWGAARYAAYLITRDHAPAVVNLGPADAIERVVLQLQNQLRSPGGMIQPPEAGNLYKLVIQPLLAPLAKLQPRLGQLLLSPDGALNLVPMAALIDQRGHYLGEQFTLSYLTSGRDLLRMTAASRARVRSGITVVAAPDYNAIDATTPAWQNMAQEADTIKAIRATDFDRTGMHFSPLPGTQGEADLLKKLFKLDPAQIATGARASEAYVKGLQGPRILHIATHGFFLNDQAPAGGKTRSGRLGRGEVESVPVASTNAAPRQIAPGETPLLRSGLALAGANARNSADGEDGILTAAEAAQLDLQGTQLVVLSACETGTGDVANGEGVYGLRRALVLAGAQSQLVSLWKVDDAATEQLMGEYYRRLARGEGRAQALRSAQAVLRSNPTTAHPYYWAAFIPVGDWRPMRPQ